MPIVISMTNRKGGVGKSTATINLGAALARAGKSVLLADFDPQATLTAGLFGDAALPAGATVVALFGDRLMSPERLIVATRFPGLSLLPGSPALDEFNLSRPSEDTFVLRDFLECIGDKFDRILIDCPPNLYALLAAAMTAADFVLCPTKADPDGVAALPFVNQEIARIQGSVNPGLVTLGYVLGDHYPRNGVYIAHAAMLKQDFPALLFENVIPHATVFVEARNALTPIGFYKPRSSAAKSVVLIMEEMEAKMTRLVSMADHGRAAAA